MRARLWFRLQIGGAEWSVYFTSRIGILEGECDSHKARISLSTRLARSRIYDVLWHEIGHAAIFMTGGQKALAESLGGDFDDMSDVEEMFVSTSLHCMFQTMSGAGWLRMPEIPEWIK